MRVVWIMLRLANEGLIRKNLEAFLREAVGRVPTLPPRPPARAARTVS
jgi:hypothetical protein